MQPHYLTLVQFAILLELLLEKAYPDQLDKLPAIPDYKLYGYNHAAGEANSLRVKLSSHGDINARALRDAVADYYDNYNREGGEVKLPFATLKTVLAFLGYDDPTAMTTAYLRRHELQSSDFQPPYPLKYRPEKGKRKRPKEHIDSRLNGLSHTNWWVYTRHHSSTESSLKILRRGLQIRGLTLSGDCDIILWNRPPYSTFSGRILRNFSGDNILDCEMASTRHSVRKRMYMLLHVNFNQNDDGALFLGLYITHSDNAAIRTGTMVIKRAPRSVDESELIKPVILTRDDGSLDEDIKKFLHQKNLNQLKLPRGIFHKEDLNEWLKQKRQFHALPVYDLYVAAPVRGIYHQRRRADELKQSILKLLANELPGEKSQSLADGLDRLIEQHCWNNEATVADYKDLVLLQQEIRKMIRELKARKLGFKNIWYSMLERDFNPNSRVHPSKLLSEQFEEIRRSRAYLFILPQPVLSSVLTQIGWALMASLMTQKPIFVLYSSEEDLPFILRNLDALDSQRIFMESLGAIGGIAGIADWLQENRFHELLDP